MRVQDLNCLNWELYYILFMNCSIVLLHCHCQRRCSVVWYSFLTTAWEVRVRFPLNATAIRLASECTFARVNPCHVREIGYHYSDTRVWVDIPGIVTCRDTRYRFGLAMNPVLPVSFECQGIRHDSAARTCRVPMSGSAVIPYSLVGRVGPIPRYRRA